MTDHIYELISYGDLTGGKATEARRISKDYVPSFLLPLSAVTIEEKFSAKIGQSASDIIMRVRIPDHIARSRGLDPVRDAPRDGWELFNPAAPAITPVAELENMSPAPEEDYPSPAI